MCPLALSIQSSSFRDPSGFAYNPAPETAQPCQFDHVVRSHRLQPRRARQRNFENPSSLQFPELEEQANPGEDREVLLEASQTSPTCKRRNRTPKTESERQMPLCAE
jgi:hypothetical protein